jgi:hypothetical protein
MGVNIDSCVQYIDEILYLKCLSRILVHKLAEFELHRAHGARPMVSSALAILIAAF